MSYVVTINLEYDAQGKAPCLEIWEFIKESMLEKGFRLDGRLFISSMAASKAIKKAKQAIDDIEAHHDFESKQIYRYIREFYGYEPRHVTNLLLPMLDVAETTSGEITYARTSLTAILDERLTTIEEPPILMEKVG